MEMKIMQKVVKVEFQLSDVIRYINEETNIAQLRAIKDTVDKRIEDLLRIQFEKENFIKFWSD